MVVRPLKAISIRQPWAWAIFHGEKDVENRSPDAARQMQKAVGQTVYIHASKSDPADADLRHAIGIMKRLKIKPPEKEDWVRGAFIGTVRVLEIVVNSQSPWYSRGMQALVLADPKPLRTPIPARGQVGLFDARRAAAALAHSVPKAH